MRRTIFALMVAAVCPILVAQQSLNNDSVVKLVKAGLSDDLIISTVNASPGSYDTSADGLIALKKAEVPDGVVAAIVKKMAATATAAPMPAAPPRTEAIDASPPAPQRPTKPRVFLQSASKGNRWNAARDQSMEMGKDFDKNCPEVQITINQQLADYTIVLNHIEVGFARDNQFQIANKVGDLISKTKEGGSINGGVKKACELILADWVKGLASQ
jgi:hypothetical protein